jgi:hypothetical protein
MPMLHRKDRPAEPSQGGSQPSPPDEGVQPKPCTYAGKASRILFKTRLGIGSFLVIAAVTIVSLPGIPLSIGIPLCSAIGGAGLLLVVWHVLNILGLPFSVCPYNRSSRLCDKTIRRIRDRLLRRRYYLALRDIGAAWVSLINAPLKTPADDTSSGDDVTTHRHKRLALSFFSAYAREEYDDVKKNHLVMTNFVAYGTILGAILKEVEKLHPRKHRVLYTQLCMPVSRWFNYRTRPNGDGKIGPDGDLPGNQVDGNWVGSYLQFLYQTVRIQSGGGTTVKRFVPVVESNDKSFSRSFNDPQTLMRDLSSFILVPHDTDPEAEEFLQPLDNLTIRGLISEINKCDQRVAKHLSGLYSESTQAYLILPNTRYERKNGSGEWVSLDYARPPEPSQIEYANRPYVWKPLVEVFTDLFHRNPRDACVYAVDDRNIAFLKSHYPNHRIGRLPEDFVLFGVTPIMDTGPPEWLCCLAAEVDSEIDKLKLWYLDDDIPDAYDISINQDRPLFTLSQILEYVNYELEKDAKTMNDWMHSKLPRDGLDHQPSHE